MFNSEEINQLVDNTINEFSRIFLRYPNIVLTEEDARCYLYSLLLKKSPLFSSLSPTEDNSISIPLHTEIRWYGADKKLKKRSDIVVIRPNSLLTRNQGSMKVHSKGFSFNDYFAIIEIKMRRVNGATDNNYISYIADDIQKLRNLVVEGAKFNNIENPNYYLICLDKKNNISALIRDRILITEPNLKLTYLYK